MKKYEEGQILLIVILVMTVALTIGLSVATHTITTVRTSAEEESSQRAFSAAEAGLEQALQNSTNISGSFTNSASYQTTVTTLAGNQVLLNNGSPLLKDEPVDVWLSTYPTYASPWSGTMTIYWGKSSDVCDASEATNSLAALEIVLIYGTKVNPQVTQYPVDPCGARAGVNKFELIPSGGGTINGKSYAYRKTIVVASGLLMRIIPLYAPSQIAVTGCNSAGGGCIALPAQGSVISSVGTSDTTQRKIIGVKSNPQLPIQMFPFVIFSPK